MKSISLNICTSDNNSNNKANCNEYSYCKGDDRKQNGKYPILQAYNEKIAPERVMKADLLGVLFLKYTIEI